jgi:hypothetical protein
MSEHIIVLADRVKELSRTTGSGNIVLDGAATGFGSFAGSYTYNDALFYAVTDGINYEVGSGQYILDGSDDALTRFPFHSSNSNAAVDFPAGVKEVYVTYPGKYAVMTGSGLSGFDEPDASGLAFWGSNQILNYDSNVIWDKTNSRLGINNAAPSYTIDIGGEGTDSSIRVSGLIIGTSGITFSNGVQLTAYTENALDATTGTDAVFALSGVSNQIIQFQEQNAGLFFAGPPSGCNPSGACAPDMPTFRVITDDDLPSLASMYLTQDPAAYDSGGMGSGVAFWATSGVVDHDPYFVWDKTQNFLGVNKLVPTKELDVDGDGYVSGVFTVGGDLNVSGSITLADALFDTAGNNAATTDIFQSDTLVVSGVSGVSVAVTTDGTVKTLTIDPSVLVSGFGGSGTNNLAGILANSASGVAISGWASTNFTSQDGRLTVNEAGILANSASGVAISGWADYTIDASGEVLDTLAYDISGWAKAYADNISLSGGLGWTLSDELSNTELITNDTVIVSGISGVNAFYDTANGVMTISAGSLSGLVANNATDIATNSASGVAISGWVAAGGSTLSAGSGLIVQSSVIHTSGTANFERIVFGNTSTESINIGTDAGDGYTGVHSVFVGNVAGYNITGTNNYLTSVGYNSFTDCDTVSHGSAFGYYAGYDSRDISYGVFVGPNAGQSAGESDNMVAIGNSAGRSTVESVSVVGIGYQALMNASGAEYSVNIGYQAGYSSYISDFSINLGYRAGNNSLNSWANISAGYDAGQSSVSNTYTINLGKESAYTAVENSYCSFIGYRSGYQASGNNESIGFGEQAFYGADNNHKATALGYYAMRNSSGVQESVMLGDGVAQGASSLSGIVAGGYGAAANATSSSGCVLLGHRAGRGVDQVSDSIMIGKDAGLNAYEIQSSVTLGENAGYDSKLMQWGVNLGYSAGLASSGNTYTNNIGHNAGVNSNSSLDMINIGSSAGSSSSDADYSIHIGSNAGYSSNGSYAVHLGLSAGQEADGAGCVYIGYSAGRGRSGSNSVVIRGGTELQTANDWAATSQSGIIDIGKAITGLDTGYIRIGDTGTVAAIGEATLSVKPVDNNDIGLKLWRSTSTPSEPLAVAELSGGADNLFINKNGYLAIPTYASVAAATGAVSPTSNEGVMLLGGSGLLVTDGTSWYTVPLSLVV